jgi:hypothetical protein
MAASEWSGAKLKWKSDGIRGAKKMQSFSNGFLVWTLEKLYFMDRRLKAARRTSIQRITKISWQQLIRAVKERQFKEEQIVGTQEKPQWIVAQRLLSHLQYLDATKSSAKDLSPAQFNLLLLEDSLAKIPAAEIRLGLFLFT